MPARGWPQPFSTVVKAGKKNTCVQLTVSHIESIGAGVIGFFSDGWASRGIAAAWLDRFKVSNGSSYCHRYY